jgi:hypothetical protein
MAAMERRQVLALVRGLSAAIVFFSIAYQAVTLAGGPGGFDPTRFFAFFTILSNLFGASLFLVLAVRRPEGRSGTLDVLRGASVVYLTVTFIVVILLLSGDDLQVAVPWVDFAVHKFFPVVVVLDWLIDPPAARLTARQAAAWLVYPIVWVTLTLIRGAADGWYPYPFLDPANGGYGSVAFYFVAILVGFLVIAAAVMAVGNARRGRPAGSGRPAGIGRTQP